MEQVFVGGSGTLNEEAKKRLTDVTSRNRAIQVADQAAQQRQAVDRQMLETLKIIAGAIISGKDTKEVNKLVGATNQYLMTAGKADPGSPPPKPG
jgi:hypothetical protein